MNEQYYVPSIEDIRVGYECELRCVNEHLSLPTIQPGADFKKIILSENTINGIRFSTIIEKGLIQTPYLTKEQIEAEGWKFKTEYTGKFRFVFEKDNNWLAWNPEEHMMTIIPIDPSEEFYEHNVRYAGSCPSINEFRTITKLLNIK